MERKYLIFLASLTLCLPLFVRPTASADEPTQSETKRLEPNYIRPGADPWVIEFNGKYYWSQSNNPAQSICVWESETPDNPGERHTIWRAPRRGPYSRELWAPEIHHYNGKFYVLFAADDGQNKNHRTYVLVSESDDPFSKYELHGPVYTGDSEDGQSDNHWAIDSTIFPYKDKFYLIWSGWEDDQDVQYLYIAPLKENLTETAGPRVKICHNADYLWERVEERLGTRGLAEGPEILEAPNGRIFLTYSCGASWLPTYKIGILELVGDDPMKSESWKKFDKPWFQSDEFQFGVGHGSFIRDKDGQTRYVYHAKTDRNGGWGDRAVFWRYVDFDEDGTPSIRY
ncbi:MAG: glycoside hydrolase family 43 protein [Thermoguttaceae bacterium]|nr:glycoside hydrolase family 43 protein [Thermoguttaceae bacterium]